MSDDTAGRIKLAPILTTVILTVLLLWMVGTTADVFLLLFIAVIFSLYLGAVKDFLVHRARVPERFAFFLAVVGTVVALGGLMTLLVPPVVEQTRPLVSLLPA